MLLMNRFGAASESPSIRVHSTDEAGSASALVEMNNLPVVVAAHATLVFLVLRSIAEIAPPARSPHDASVSHTSPSSSQSPQVSSNVPVQELQIRFASSIVRSPMPNVLVRNTVRPVPANMVPLTT